MREFRADRERERVWGDVAHASTIRITTRLIAFRDLITIVSAK
jgi:hypothetical protein